MMRFLSSIVFVLSTLLLSAHQAQSNEIDFGLEFAELRAQVVPVRFALLSAEMTGKVETLSYKEGEKVQKNASILTFACDLQDAQLDKAIAQLKASHNLFVGSQRMAELNAIGQIDLANAELEVEKAQADVDYLKATLKRCAVKAPYSGVIGDVSVRQYELIQVGAPLVEVIDDSKLQLEFIAPSKWLGWLKPGLVFDVLIEDLNKVFTAEVEYTAAKVDVMSQSIKVVAVLTSDTTQLKAGMSGRIRLTPPSVQ